MGGNRWRIKAQEALRGGRVPSHPPSRMNAGRGLGAPCMICSEQVTRDEPGWELEFSPAEGGGQGLVCDMHVSCFVAWELERQKFLKPQFSTPLRRRILSAAESDGKIAVRADQDAIRRSSR
jgi:hypothetical protein